MYSVIDRLAAAGTYSILLFPITFGSPMYELFRLVPMKTYCIVAELS